MNNFNHIYFETSAVNYLFDNVFNNEKYSSFETRKLQTAKGRKWQISNIALWEIFLTKKQSRREVLFDFSRSLFHEELLSSPEEIIINYLKAGCPKVEKKYPLISKSLFAKEWKIACNDSRYFFEPNREQLELYTEHFRFIGNYFVKNSKGYIINTDHKFNEFTNKIDNAFLKSIYDKLLKLHSNNPDEKFKLYLSISLQITMIVLCFGIGFDQQTIENFWNQKSKTEPLERLDIVANKYTDLFFRGPLSNIAKMIILQFSDKTGRGLFFDSLHSIYTTYCDLYVSADDHFEKFKNDNVIDPNMHKVINVKQMIWK